MRHRRLALRRETLSELATAELALVAGGEARPTSPITLCVEKLKEDVTVMTSYLVSCDSLVNACPSSPCTR